MVLANIEWVGTLCTALTIACTIQLITTGILTITVPDVLSLTNSYIPTVTGLIASLITLPTALRLKTSQMLIKTTAANLIDLLINYS